jgi:poly(hydroxyalkanoate) depolymerase family esterase
MPVRCSIAAGGLAALAAVATAMGSANHAQAAQLATPAGCQVVAGAALGTDGWSNEPSGGTHLLCSYTTQGLTRTYWMYEPPGLPTGAPLIVVLHGCTEQGPDVAYLSHFDAESVAHGFTVVYPNQAAYTMTSTTTFDGNGSNCWNWFLPQGQARGAGEPALIAGITRIVAAAVQADAQRVYVTGISAGGALADIMAATYPDIYASTAMLAGCEYMGLPCLGSAAAQPPQLSGQEAYQASTDSTGNHARVVPFLVENGDADTTVPVANAPEVVQQWQITDAYAANGGTLPSPVPSQACASQSVVPNPATNTSVTPPIVYNPYTVAYYSADGSACPQATSNHACALGEMYIVHGEEHAWPGGPNLNTTQSTGEIFTNPGGPDITDIAYQFFMAHPMRPVAGACNPAAVVPDAPVSGLLLGAGASGLLIAVAARRRRRHD